MKEIKATMADAHYDLTIPGDPKFAHFFVARWREEFKREHGIEATLRGRGADRLEAMTKLLRATKAKTGFNIILELFNREPNPDAPLPQECLAEELHEMERIRSGGDVAKWVTPEVALNEVRRQACETVIHISNHGNHWA